MPNWKKIILSGSSANLNNLYTENAVTASFFKGDGSAITNVSATVAEVATVSDTFTNASSKEVTHNFDTKNVVVSVYNNSDELILPATIKTTTNDTVDITFNDFGGATGRVVVAKGGHIVSGSASTAGNGFPFTGSAEITGSLTVTGSVKLTGQLKVGVLSQASNRNVSFDDRFNLIAANNQSANLLFGDPDDDGKGSIRYSNSDDSFDFRTDGDSALKISSNQTASFANLVSASRFRGKSAQIYDDSNFAYFSHVNRSTPSNYSFMSSPLGSTFINVSGSGQTIQFLERNGSIASFNQATASFASNHFIVASDTGSFLGHVSASSFSGDGSGLTGLSAIGTGVTTTEFNSTASFNQDINQYAAGTIVLKSALDFSDDNRRPSTRVSLYHNDSFAGQTESLRLDGLTGGAIFSGEVRVPLLPTSSYSAISKQYLESTRFEQTLTGDTSYTVTHNLNEDYPIVQVYDNNKFQVLPASVKVTNANVVNLTFATYANFEGKVVVKK
tara:strand:+ start:2262 stop:3770 length:1509 start_codon:yes stop_codon:yes gene_type:complete